MMHFFDSEFARQYGIEEAVIFQNLVYWIEKNRANEKNFFDGMYWTYNSTKAYATLFPYLSERAIYNALRKLEDKGLIKTGNYNKDNRDRTKWYTVTETGYCILQNCQMHFTFLQNANCENVRPLPNINNTDYKTADNNQSSSARAREEMKSGTDNAVQAFLSKYQQVAVDTITADLSAVDFPKVAEAFKKSGYLRTNAKSLAWICDNHGKIESGFYADHEKTDKTEKPLPKSVRDANARAERERWYAKRRAEAEAIADKNRTKAEKNADYVKTARELSELEMQWAKASSCGLPTEEALRLRMIAKMDERDGYLRMMSLTAEDLNPKWNCAKCKDTGFDKLGNPCGCYEERKE